MRLYDAEKRGQRFQKRRLSYVRTFQVGIILNVKKKKQTLRKVKSLPRLAVKWQ